MKNRAIIFLFAAALLFSCRKPEKVVEAPIEFSLDQKAFTLSALTQNVTFNVSAPGLWSAVIPEDARQWAALSQSEGGRGNTEVTLTVGLNESESRRRFSLEICCGQESKRIAVTQLSAGTIISPSQLDLEGKASISIDCPGDWTVDFTSDSGQTPAWLTVSPTTGKAGKFTLTIEEKEKNTKWEDRQALLNLHIGKDTFTAVISQIAQDAIEIKEDRVEVSPEGGIFSIHVRSNVEPYTLTIQEQTLWIEMIPTKAVTERELSFIAEKGEFSSREAKIIVEYENARDEVTVYQPQLDQILLSEDELSIPSSGGTITVDVRANVEFIASSSESWVHIEDKSTLTVDMNLAIDPREAIISFSAISSSLSASLKIVQEGSTLGLFCDKTDYGLYFMDSTDDNWVYTPVVDQMAFSNGDEVAFRLMNTKTGKYMSLSGITNEAIGATQGETQAQLTQNHSNKIPTSAAVSIVKMKEDDTRLWLYNQKNNIGFIIGR